MGNADKYRANAHRCQRVADKVLTPEDKLNWLNMAVTWLGMIPGRQRVPEEMFEEVDWDQGTGHEPRKSRH